MTNFNIENILLKNIESFIADYTPNFDLLTKNGIKFNYGCDGCSGCNPCTGGV